MPSDDDFFDFGTQIRDAVASSTEWINDTISDIKNGVHVRADSVRYRRTPDDLRREAEIRRRKQEEYIEQTKNEQIRKSRIGHISSGIGHGFGQLAGGFFAFWFGIALIASIYSDSLSGIIIFGFITALCVRFTWYSTQKRLQLKRFVRYVRMIKDRLYVNVDDFVDSLGYSRKNVLKDLRAMIEMGILKQGHIDSEGRTLMLTDETYQQYLTARESYEAKKKLQEADDELNSVIDRQKKKDAKKQRDRAMEDEILSDIDAQKREELDAALVKGRAYIKEIREANDLIPGEEISKKLDRLETAAGQIFTIVEEHPGKLPEIHKFMDYYLPTTLKLLKNYQEFDMQQVQGDNITRAKKEIEDTLDMINMAFENLSDRLYQDVAMEVSADISVLQSLLAQEGLKEKDFILK